MELINGKLKRIVASEGKHIRSRDDVYIPKHIDENGNVIEEHKPYYSTIIYVPDAITEEKMHELYVEEEIE